MLGKLQISVALLLLAALLPVGPTLAREGEAAAAQPFYLAGIDLGLPAQEAFREWPPATLTDRPYWTPWGWMTFRRAALFARPVVMILTVEWSEIARKTIRETLSDPRVLRRINQDFITIYVNADRRPDIQERYQTGNWPVIALLLPDGNPMLSRANDLEVARPIVAGEVTPEAMIFLLDEANKYWQKSPHLLMNQGQAWARAEGQAPPVTGEVSEESSDLMAGWLAANSDRAQGGFGIGPRYVVPGLMELAALRAARQADDLRPEVQQTLEKFVGGPLLDTERGGLRRMAMTADWQGVQPEKLLLGNAQFVRELTLALRDRDSEQLREALVSISHFIAGTLQRDEGGFCLAAYPDAAGSEARDCLVVSGPTALAGAALLRAGMLLGDEPLIATGTRAIDFVLDHGYRPGWGVRHVIAPHPDERVFLEAQADTALGLLDAYESTGTPAYLRAAIEIVDLAVLNLLVPGETTLRDHLEDAEPIGLLANPRRPLRPNVRLARAMLRIMLHGRGVEYAVRARAILETHAGDLSLFGLHGAEAAVAIEERLFEPLRIEIAGSPPATRAIRAAALTSPWPWTVVTTAEESSAAAPSATLLWRGERTLVADEAALHETIRRLTGRGGT